MFSLDHLKKDIANQLSHTFLTEDVRMDFNEGKFLITTKTYKLEITLSPEEVSYSFWLTDLVNEFRVGVALTADYYPYIGDPKMEKIVLGVYDQLINLLKNIKNNDIYVGGNNANTYIAWREGNSYILKSYKKSFLKGIVTTEKTVSESHINELGLKGLKGWP